MKRLLSILLAAIAAFPPAAALTRTVETADTVVRILSDSAALRPHSEEFDLKTNLLSDALGTMSLAGEVRLSRRASLEVGVAWNPWTFSEGLAYRQWEVMPELRWWPKQSASWDASTSALAGHYLGVHLLGGEFSFNKVSLPLGAAPSLRSNRYEGWMLGGGVSYGYRWNISHRFALEPFISLGLAHISYSRYDCGRCGERLARGTRLYAGPTKAGVNLTLRIGRNPRMKRCAAMETETIITHRIQTITSDTIVLTPAPQVIVSERKETAMEMKVHHADFTLRLRYPLNGTGIEPQLGDNALQIDSLRSFIARYKDDPTVRISRVEVVGYASLEGPEEGNRRLSAGRAESAAALIAGMYPGLAMQIQARGAGEDWASPHFAGKEELMAVADADLREQRLRRLEGGELFRRLLATQLPATRRIECTIYFTYVTQEKKNNIELNNKHIN